MNNITKFVLLAVVGLIAGISLALIARNLFTPYEFQGGVITPPEPVRSFTLTDVEGNIYTEADFEDKVLAIYFGYTFCPDICPATMGDLASAIRQMGDDGDAVQVVMVTTDPERDTAATLADYVARFDDSFIGLTGTTEQLETIYQNYGIYVQKQEGTAETGYLVDHTSTVIVIDKNDQWRLLFPFGMTSEAMARDLGELVGE
jgi:protein SCO1/2